METNKSNPEDSAADVWDVFDGFMRGARDALAAIGAFTCVIFIVGWITK